MSRVIQGAEPKEVDAADHPVLTGKMTEGIQIPTDSLLRKYATSPELRGKKAKVWEYKIKDRVVALVFEADVTSGLLGTNTWGIFGYSASASEAILWNALKWIEANPLKAEKK
jgi:hypothetical protein